MYDLFSSSMTLPIFSGNFELTVCYVNSVNAVMQITYFCPENFDGFVYKSEYSCAFKAQIRIHCEIQRVSFV